MKTFSFNNNQDMAFQPRIDMQTMARSKFLFCVARKTFWIILRFIFLKLYDNYVSFYAAIVLTFTSN